MAMAVDNIAAQTMRDHILREMVSQFLGLMNWRPVDKRGRMRKTAAPSGLEQFHQMERERCAGKSALKASVNPYR
jgi:hypothetical protein